MSQRATYCTTADDKNNIAIYTKKYHFIAYFLILEAWSSYEYLLHMSKMEIVFIVGLDQLKNFQLGTLLDHAKNFYFIY